MEETKFKVILKPPLIALVLTFMITFLWYAITHFVGGVIIPDWYLENDDNKQPFEPLPVSEFVEYWIHRGLIFSLLWGFSVALVTLLYSVVKYRRFKV